MEKVVTVSYKAKDGKMFSSQEECLKYEKEDELLDKAFKKVKFLEGNNEDLNIPIENLKAFFRTNGTRGFSNIDCADIDIVKISTTATKEEIELLTEFFQLFRYVTGIDIPTYAGMVVYWDDNVDEWMEAKDELQKLKERCVELENMIKF